MFVFTLHKTKKQSVYSSYIMVLLSHNENLPMQYTEIFSGVKYEKKMNKKMIFFLFLLKTLYFWSKNKKYRYTPAYPSFAI